MVPAHGMSDSIDSTESGHVASYYAASANAFPKCPELTEAVDCDVCVIGGGITGSSAALELAGRGFSTVLLEANRIGWGASGRSGGQAIFGFGCDQTKLERIVGRDQARQLWDLSLESLALMRDRIGEHGIECGYRAGQMHAAIKARQRNELIEWQRLLQDDYGYESLRLIERDELRELMATERYIAGLFDSNSGHLHPLNYTLGLNQAAQRAGARVYEGSPVLAVEEGDRITTVRTPGGRVRCRYLAVCCNAYLGNLVKPLRSKIMPVGTYIVATETLGNDLASSLIRNDMAVADINFVLDYFRLSEDTRMLFGGRVSYSKIPPPTLSRSIRARMIKVYPQLAEAKIDYYWGGYVAITVNRAPHFGRVGKNIFFAQGFSGHGIALTGLAGSLIGEAVAGTAERFDLFSRIPHMPFPGGPALRTPALVLAMAYFRLRDLL
jgi:gamma-glutamylputrescine oxidase